MRNAYFFSFKLFKLATLRLRVGIYEHRGSFVKFLKVDTMCCTIWPLSALFNCIMMNALD